MYIVKAKQGKPNHFIDYFVFVYRMDAVSLKDIISDRFYKVKVCRVEGF